MLRINFFDYILELNDANKYRYVFKGYPIPVEYEKIKQALQIRHKVVHDVYDADLSGWKIICLYDNAMNIMDVWTSLFIPELQGSSRMMIIIWLGPKGREESRPKGNPKHNRDILIIILFRRKNLKTQKTNGVPILKQNFTMRYYKFSRRRKSSFYIHDEKIRLYDKYRLIS